MRLAVAGFAEGQGAINKGQEGGFGQTPHGLSKPGSYGITPALKARLQQMQGSTLLFSFRHPACCFQ